MLYRYTTCVKNKMAESASSLDIAKSEMTKNVDDAVDRNEQLETADLENPTNNDHEFKKRLCEWRAKILLIAVCCIVIIVLISVV